MDTKIEKEFIQSYIKRDYQQRILYELTKKREKALSRFSHDVVEFLKKDLIILKIKDESFILNNKEYKDSFNEECYFISRFYDGIIIKLDVALKEAFNDLCSSIIISKKFAIIKEETEIGKPNIYFIQSK